MAEASHIQSGDSVTLGFTGEYSPPDGGSVVLDFGAVSGPPSVYIDSPTVLGEPSVEIRVRSTISAILNAPHVIGAPTAQVVMPVTVHASADGMLGVPSFLIRKSVRAPTGIQHESTTSSLTFTWDSVPGADGYLATLDGVEQDVTATEVTFSDLEDGTEYTLTLRAYIATGEGDTATYQATTQYLPPAPPANVQWGPPRALGIITSWEVPEKVTFLQSAIMLQGRPVAAEILEPTETSRDWWLPYAGREFTWRIRTGNPGGYSEWVETTVYTTDILVDSRPAALGAAYQEDHLYPDTWDGGTDRQGEGDPQGVRGGVEISNPMARRMPIRDSFDMGFTVEVGAFQAVDRMQVYTAEIEPAEIGFTVEVGEFRSAVNVIEYTASDIESADIDFTVEIGDFTTVTRMATFTDDDNTAEIGFTVEVGDFTTEVPA